MSEENKSLDLLGVKPIADSVNTVTEGTVKGASAFLSRICLPAAEEFGLLLKDKVSSWRAKNAVEIANKAQALLEHQVGNVVLHAHPRIVYATIENGSWAEDDFMQKLWSGLLASSCTKTGKDESNLILINLLSQITTSQARLINYVCQHCTTYQSTAGWLGSLRFTLDLPQLIEVMGVNDIHQIDRELDHLRALELISGGFQPEHTLAEITPMALGLHLYVRSQGYVGDPISYFDAPIMTQKEIEEEYDLENDS
ncbi:DUF4393 domain-containing protein [Aeromonas veronii]|uniref:DUF4393 domain-containing protein n=1 Tax=Aeromonas veronii TaxID=654 RepID=UPI0020917C57|nr:DUF4393 domain-containing protein [Aeromonas veronii]MCO5341459.1 DUF4393 domain-containing protein [Aeromonas veronii]